MGSDRTFALKQGRYVCHDGVWYMGLDVVGPDGERVDTQALKELHLVERGYVCEDGVWYRQVAAARG